MTIPPRSRGRHAAASNEDGQPVGDDLPQNFNGHQFPPPPAGYELPYQPQQPGPSANSPQPEPVVPRSSAAKQRKPKKTGSLVLGFMILGVLAIGAIVTAVSLSSGGKPTASRGADIAAASTPSAAAQPRTCMQQLVSWRDGGGLAQLKAVTTDLSNSGTAMSSLGQDLSSGTDPTSDESTVQTSAGALQADIQAAQSNLPPACVPNMRQDESAALTDYNKGAIDGGQAVSELTSGNDEIAAGDLTAAASAINAGTTKLSAADSDVKSFSA
jgi:hypothetical protein